MSRVSQKRNYESSSPQAESGFGEYSKPLSHQDLKYLDDAGVPQRGFLSGRVVGTSFTHGMFCVELEMQDRHILALRFEGHFALRIQQVAEFGSNIRVSTRGAVVDPGRMTTLRYSSGAHVSIETVLNAWAGQGTAEQRQNKRVRYSQNSAPRQLTSMSDDTWLNTQQSAVDVFVAEPNDITYSRARFSPTELPTPRTSSPMETMDALRSSFPTSDNRRLHGALLAARSLIPDDEDSPMDDDVSYAQDRESPTPAESSRTIKNREKALGKRKKREEKRRKSEIGAQSTQRSTTADELSSSSQDREEVENILAPSTSSDAGGEAPVSESLLDTFRPEVVMGFMTNFTPIEELFVNQKESFIGVVHHVGELEQSMRNRRDWYRKVTLIDPSNFDRCGGVLYDESRPVGLSVTMFNKYIPWIPKAAPGDILLVNNAKVVRLNGDSKLSATAYSDQFKWALFGRQSRSFCEIDLDDAPKSHIVKDNHVETEYTPFLVVAEEERAHCEKLAAWWDEVQQRRAEKRGVVQHIGDDPVPLSTPGPSSRPPKRKHQLIKDVDYRIMPYFDCTVEIVYVAQSNDMTLVYATDYTANTTGLGLRPVRTEWCPANLATSALQIEFYGSEAANFVREQQLDKGQLWTFCNVRMKPGRGDQYLEANFSETRKAYRLEEEEKNKNSFLADLLIRKKEFEESNNSPHEFEHQTIGEAEVGSVASLFTCTVEVLSVSKSTIEGAPAKIYVTDYTSRADLKAPLSPELREKHKDAVLMVQLDEGQAERADKLSPGNIIRIQNLRAKIGLDGKVSARIGGGDNLIRKLDASSDDLHVIALLERKALSGAGAPEPPPRPIGKPVNVKVPPSFARSRPAPDASTRNAFVIGQILDDASEEDKMFQMKARVADYEPKDLAECIVRACTVCSEPVEADDPQCPVCSAGAENLKYRFGVTLTLVDAPRPFGDTALDVFATGDWAALSDLDPETLVLSGDGAEMISARLRKYIWHIENDGKKRPGSEFEFTIERRRDADGEVQYFLITG
ncbi:unnamed protein product [Peniophora sp. CBMAI 1063]|nr:unnamed protein product [Peniophora sp. CBMAI 1063]